MTYVNILKNGLPLVSLARENYDESNIHIYVYGIDKREVTKT